MDKEMSDLNSVVFSSIMVIANSSGYNYNFTNIITYKSDTCRVCSQQVVQHVRNQLY